MRGSQTVHIHSCMPSILCTRCALGSLNSISYNTWYNKYTAAECIAYLAQEQEQQEQRKQRENDAVVEIIVNECEKYRNQNQATLEANSALIELASSSKNGTTGNATDDIDWITLIKEAISQ